MTDVKVIHIMSDIRKINEKITNVYLFQISLMKKLVRGFKQKSFSQNGSEV